MVQFSDTLKCFEFSKITAPLAKCFHVVLDSKQYNFAFDVKIRAITAALHVYQPVVRVRFEIITILNGNYY